MTDWVADALMRCAEIEEDLTPVVYQNFFARYPDALPLMEHTDEHIRGRMLSQAYELLLEEPDCEPGGYWDWEINNHVQAYAVHPAMYPPFFAAIEASVAATLGDAWQPEHANAWKARCQQLLDALTALSQAN